MVHVCTMYIHKHCQCLCFNSNKNSPFVRGIAVIPLLMTDWNKSCYTMPILGDRLKSGKKIELSTVEPVDLIC